MTEFDELRNRCERAAEKQFPGSGNTPGYRACRHGEWTPGAQGHDSTAGPLPPLRIPLVNQDGSFKTQLVLTDGNEEMTYWVDAPRAWSENAIVSAILVGDIIELFEVPRKMAVLQVCLTLPEDKICVPHKTGTLLTWIERSERRKR